MSDLWKLGIGPWKVYTFDPSNTTNQTYRGKPCEFTLKVCFAVLDSIVWELMEPISGPTIMGDFLQEHGEGIHHIAFDCNHIPWQERLDEFQKRGLSLVQTGSWMGKNSFAFFEGERGGQPTTFETYFFPENWEYPPAEAEYPLANASILKSSISNIGVLQTIPARSGMAVSLEKGQVIKIINTHGKQVVDTWAFVASDLKEYMSMSHSRASTLHISPLVGDTLVTNLRNPILTVVEDTTPGVHDTLIAACDKARYEGLGVVGHHDNCSDNLRNALLRVGRVMPVNTPDPLNLFMNIPVSERGGLAFESPTSSKGQFVRLRAEMDCIVVMSACPQDLVKVNDMQPVEANFVVEE
jgi:uncharacterized protein YcgI (DUF1989 family)